MSAVWDGGRIRFAVSDNGIGMTRETLEALQYDIEHGNGEKGYGLYNVNRRLKLYYELQDGIVIESEYKKGTTVSFVLDVGD